MFLLYHLVADANDWVLHICGCKGHANVSNETEFFLKGEMRVSCSTDMAMKFRCKGATSFNGRTKTDKVSSGTTSEKTEVCK